MMTEKTKKIFKYIIISIVVFISVIALIIGGFIFLITYNPEYTHFGKKRTAKMEQMFGITVTDDIELERYSEFEFLAQLDYTLYINNIDDYNKFMKENVKGKIIQKAENGTFYDYQNNTQETSDYYENELWYVYTWDNNKIYADFYYSDGKYSAALNISR